MGSNINRTTIGKAQKNAMLRQRDPSKTAILYGLALLCNFQKRLFPLKIHLVELNVLHLMLPFFTSVLFGHCVMSHQFLLSGLSLFVQLSCIHTITEYWHKLQKVWDGDTVGNGHEFWNGNGCL